ncbi:hypothetical protein CPJCM30710_18470 [Clostridium polyendosporum]|uniref:YhaN AAA domain-containing protein n=1 Tax=Clostridium polyendosporum TaxID=69208 RepID=A0A919RZH2_9CLOT|nr:AAA family ATPase [Clostridium polyendosporum]GIM29181.1 hypothetical protein CPJCM30710_18470 [Clostridium polyendosporum]
MKIKSIRVKSFGKLKDTEIYFKEGINIVYGANESGKSTLQSFIKASLYGLNSKRSKDIKTNDRMKFLSLKSGKGEGELHIEYDGRGYIIKRKFGTTKKEDEVKVLDEITGEEIKDFIFDDIGKKFLEINATSFENTLFIKQLGGGVTSSKYDEVMHKITNAFQSGDENVSFQRALLSLEGLKKQLTTQRKNGKLDNLKIRLHNLTEERMEALRISEDNIESERALIDLKEHRTFLQKEIKRLELYKKYLKKIKLKQEYKEITDYLKKSQELKKKQEEVDCSLRTEQGIINFDFVDNIQEEISVFFSLMDVYGERKKEEEQLLEKLSEKEKVFLAFGPFNSFEEDMEQKIMKISMENDIVEEKLKTLSQIKQEIEQLHKELEDKKDFLGQGALIDEFREEIDILLSEYEDKLKELKFRVEIESILSYDVESEKYKLKNKLANNELITLSCGALIIILSALGIFKIVALPVTLILLIFSTIALLFSIKDRMNYIFFLKKIEEDSMKLKGLQLLQDNIHEIEVKLTNYFNRVRVENYRDFIMLIKKYDRFKGEIEFLKDKIRDRENKKNLMNENELIKVCNENQRAINRILTLTDCNSIEHFIEKLKEYKKIKEECKELEFRYKALKSSVDYLGTDIEGKKELIYERLKVINLEHLSLENIPEELQVIKSKIKQREEIEGNLRNVEETYKILLKDRDLDLISHELEEIINENLEYSYENEEDIERELKEKNEERLECEKRIKDVEHSIKNKFLGRRKLYVIEEDLEQVRTEIKENEQILMALNIAQETMNEAFKEIQKSFGPLLNKKVAEHLQALTDMRYNEVKVSESYEVRVTDQEGHNLLHVDYLSNGAWDQVYLSLRLALIDLIFSDKMVPIILDDAFVQYDDERIKRVLEELYKISKNKQIIIFSCQKREMEFLENRENVNIIRI